MKIYNFYPVFIGFEEKIGKKLKKKESFQSVSMSILIVAYERWIQTAMPKVQNFFHYYYIMEILKFYHAFEYSVVLNFWLQFSNFSTFEYWNAW